jgi:asparagine synthase (glutamine-hydrolysing)
MCGIAGVYSTYLNTDCSIVKTMIDTINHRGPDGDGVYQDGPVVLGHKRLAILDLSKNGLQPMESEDKAYCIVFNGEIYNYKELRIELEKLGYQFYSDTDTEVILHAYREWGRDCLIRFNGMWSFAIWDTVKQELICARDRFAIKPFVYFYDGLDFIFASEIKALLQHPKIKASPNYQAIYDFIIYGRVNHTNETFFKDIYQLPAAHYGIVNKNGMNFFRYWDINETNHFTGTIDEAALEFYRIFEDSVRLRFRSDVEVASCLSGGLDSSSIVCVADRLMNNGQINTDHWLNTFSLAFDYPQFDERKWIEMVRNATNINSHFTIPKEEELIASLNHLLTTQEEPFGGTSIFGQYMVMKLIHSQGIKVTLDGQGSDEILAGYLGYADSYFADLLQQGDREELNRQVNIYCEKHKLTPSIAIERAEKLLKTGKLGRHIEVNSKYLTPDFAKEYHHEIVLPKKFSSMLQNQLYQDLTSLSIPALLRYEDRNSMAFSIESRVPFLDYRLVEFIFSLPAEMKMNNAVTKVILRKAMHGVIPETIENRQDKMGFVTPESIWFREGFKSILEEVFNSKSMAMREYFNIEAVRQEWEAYKAGKRNYSFIIWRFACMELWLRRFID